MPDPALRLDELEAVQAEVNELLGVNAAGKPAPKASGPAPEG